MATTEEEKDAILLQANKIVAERRWRKATLRTRLMQGQILKMGRIRKRGQLLCGACNQAMTRDSEGRYIHVNKRRNRNHTAQP